MTVSRLFGNKRLKSLLLIVVVALVALASLMLLMNWLASPETSAEAPPAPLAQPVDASSPPTVTAPAASDEIVAKVNNTSISRPDWQKAAQLDAVMSKLARQPAPTAEETLDRLVNEILVLAQQAGPASSPADAAARLKTLAVAWNVSDAQLDAALAEAQLSRADLTARLARLVQVEAALGQLAAQGHDLNQWLAQARASAEIGVYRPLANASAKPATPAPSAPLTAPTAVATATAIAAPPAPPADMPVGPNPANAAPDFTLPLLAGGDVTLSQLRGKPVIINFWATWCPPCRRELPALQAAFETYGDQIGFIAVDVKEQPEQVASFVTELGLTFPIALDRDGAVSNVAYTVSGIPTTVFVDANGVVSARHVGPLDEATINTYLAPLLAQPAASEPPAPDALPVGPVQPASDFPAAPDFSLPSATGETVALKNYQDKSTVVLIFYRGHT